MRRKKCRCCHTLYLPYPQTYRQQITCNKKSCRAWRNREKWKNFIRKDPLYGQSQKVKQKQWRQSHPHYWKAWRKNHAAYVARNRRLQKVRDARKLGFLAKLTEWRAFWLQNLEKLREIKNLQNLAKATEWEGVLGQQIDGVLDYLRAQVLLAKATATDKKGVAMKQ